MLPQLAQTALSSSENVSRSFEVSRNTTRRMPSCSSAQWRNRRAAVSETLLRLLFWKAPICGRCWRRQQARTLGSKNCDCVQPRSDALLKKGRALATMKRDACSMAFEQMVSKYLSRPNRKRRTRLPTRHLRHSPLPTRRNRRQSLLRITCKKPRNARSGGSFCPAVSRCIILFIAAVILPIKRY